MAAGLAIVIPQDGSYWDQYLKDKLNCLKYQADDPCDLALKILYLRQFSEVIDKLSRKLRKKANQYSKDIIYSDIAHCLTFPNRDVSFFKVEANECFDHAQV